MKNIPFSVRVIYILTSIIYYLTIVSFAIVIFWSLAVLTGILKTDLQMNVQMPVEVNFNEIGSGAFKGQVIKMEIVEATGKVHFIDTPAKLAKRFVLSMLVIFPFVFWMVHLFYGFIKNVNSGRVFDKKNYLYLKRIAFGLISFWFFMVVYTQIFYHGMVKHFQFENVEITSGGNKFEGVLVAGILTLVLSHVFSKGQEIEAENELTI